MQKTETLVGKEAQLMGISVGGFSMNKNSQRENINSLSLLQYRCV